MAVVKVQAVANTAQATAQFNRLTASVEAMNQAMAKSSVMRNPSPQNFKKVNAAAQAAQAAWTASIAQSGVLRAEQVRMADVIERNTDLLKRHKLALNQTFGKKSRALMQGIYREQLALQNAFSMTQAATVATGRSMVNMAIPTQVSKSWDTLNNRVGMFRYRLASASTQLVNWGKNMQWTGRQLSAGLTMPMVAFGAAAGYMAYKVDKELTRIQKVYDTTAQANNNSVASQMAAQKELDELRTASTQTAIKAAHDYGSAITDTLQVQADLAATGQRGIALQKATSEVMRIATLGELEQQTATKATIALQQVFRLSTRELTEAFNYMNAIENATSLTTQDFATAIPIASAAVREYGGDIRELGVLLTAMRSRGIEAGRAANGLKATMQRLSRPSKQVQEEFMAITGESIVELVDSSESLTEIFTKLNAITKDMSDAERRDVFAGLFGSYQVATMTALVDGMEDINNQYGQTYDAQQIANKSTKEWADIADREMKRYQESVSGRFKIAWETVRAEISTMGEPFLKVGGFVLKILGKMFKAFNALPDGIKNFAAFGAIVAAMVGPFIMLIGLFANFVGSIGRGIATTLKLVSSFELLNKTEWATRATTALMEKGVWSQATAMQALQQNIMAVAEATRVMAVAQSQALKIPLPPGFNKASMTPLPVPGSIPLGNSNNYPLSYTSTGSGPNWSMYQQQAQAQYMNSLYNSGTKRFHSQPGGTGPIISQQTAAARAQVKAIGETVRAQRAFQTASAQTLRTMNQQIVATQKTRGNVSGAAVSMGVMGAAVGLMMLDINSTTNSIAKWALIGAIVVPAVKGLVAALTVGAARAWAAVAAQTQQVRLGQLRIVQEGTILTFQRQQLGLMAAMGMRARGVAAGMAGIMGPVGWITLALGAAALGMYKMGQASEEAIKKMVDQQEALSNDAEEFASQIGKAAGHYKTISTLQAEIGKRNDFQKDLEYFEGDDEKAKNTIEGFKELESYDERFQRATEIFIDYQQVAGVSATRAATRIRALYAASGMGMAEANSAADQLLATVNNIGDLNWETLLAGYRDSIDKANEKWAFMDDKKAIFEDAAKNFANVWSTAFENSDDPIEADRIFGEVEEQALSEWSKLYDQLNQMSAGRELINKEEIKSAQDLSQWYRRARDSGNLDKDLTTAGFADATGSWIAMLENANDYEKTLINAIADQNLLGKGINTVWELQQEVAIGARLLSYDEAVKEVNDLAVGLRNTLLAQAAWDGDNSTNLFEMSQMGLKELLETADPEQLYEFETALVAFATANNIKVADTPWQTYQNILNNVQMELEDTEAGVRRLRREAEGQINFNIRDDQLRDLLKTSYEGVVEDYADGISENFDKAMNAAIEGNAKMWDNRIEKFQEAQERAAEAMDKRHERITEAFDKRWEDRRKRVEDSYNKRIEKVNEAIEAEQKAEDIRQRIFEAEQARLDRLTEAANRGIDFNMALQTGDLDEAAKIRNDMDAAAQQWALSDAGAAGSRASQRRQEQLGDRIDNLEDRKDKVLEALEEEEKKRRESLERRLEMERKHLEKVQEARMKALEAEAEANKAALQESWEQRRDNLDDQLELFKSFIPKNQKQLQNWIKTMGGDFRKFGTDTLDPLSDRWAGWFKKHLHQRMRQATAEIGSDNMWEEMSSKIAKATIKGMGFANMADFRRFVMTGKLPNNFGRKPRDDSPFWTAAPSQIDRLPDAPYHQGGEIGGRGSGRKGVARTAGVHPTEQVILARKGEFMLDRDTYSKHSDLVHAMMNGNLDGMHRQSILGGATGVAGLFSGILTPLLMAGMTRALQNGFNKRYSEAQMFSGVFGTAQAGVYGDRAFSAEQLRNAGIIANVGKSLGMSGRDIAIGIMTAITESGLRNIDYGDRDSVGLFQQRTSQGWGTIEQIMNPEYAATKFFQALKGVSDRSSMSPWLAAQAVQRSFDPTGSNYRQYWDEGQAIFKALSRNPRGGFVSGLGGRHKPLDSWSSSYNIHGSPPAVDLATPVGRKVYAVQDGIITTSKDLKGDEPRAPHGGLGYRSYGRYIVIQHPGGASTLYAHLSERYAREGQNVSGGSVIGLSGNTGYSYGPHVHFGATNGPLSWLKTGGMTLNDGIAALHRGETVLTEPLTKDLQDTVKAFGKVSRDVMSGRSRIKPDANVATGFWTYLSGLFNSDAVKSNSNRKPNNSSIQNEGSIRAGTYNVGRGSNAKLRQDLVRLMPLVDVLSMQEMSGSKLGLKPWFAQRGWGYHANHQGAGLLWNKNSVRMSNAGSKELSPPGVSAGHRYAEYAKFSKKGGPSWWQIAAHTVAWPYRSHARRAEQTRQFLSLRELWKRLSSGGAPVIIGGDLNESIKRGDFIKKIGLGIGTHSGPATHGKSWLDHLLSYGLKAGNSRVIKGLSSDHNALLNTFNIPSHAKGAMNIRWDNTLINAHKGEGILTEDQNNAYKRVANNIDKFVMGSGNQYDIKVEVKDSNASPDAIAEKVIQKIRKEEGRRPQPRR